MSTALATLTPAEEALRDKHVATIRAHREGFIAAGEALAAMRDSRLYRDTHATFEDFCRAELGKGTSYAYYLIGAAETVSTIVDKTVIKTESQARELAKVDPADRAYVVEKAIQATGGKLTAAAIKEAAKPEPQDEEGEDDGEAQVIEMTPAKPGRIAIDPARFSQATMHADNACACIDKIPFGDPQLRAALSRIQKHIDARLNKETK
jgi:hypothetical protein